MPLEHQKKKSKYDSKKNLNMIVYVSLFIVFFFSFFWYVCVRVGKKETMFCWVFYTRIKLARIPETDVHLKYQHSSGIMRHAKVPSKDGFPSF